MPRITDQPEGRTPGPAGDSGRAVEAARLVSYGVIAAVSLVLFVEAGSLPASRWEPLGAGAFPRLVCGALIVLCLISAATTLRRMGGFAVFHGFGAATADWAARRRLVFVVLGLFALHLATVATLGFALSAFLFVLATALLLAPFSLRTLGIALAVAAAFSFGLDALFREVFDVFLPR
ncbi:MAG: tripartite tricarboxylate transporter TctB family protein, partial [Pseudomonadota bacterium]